MKYLSLLAFLSISMSCTTYISVKPKKKVLCSTCKGVVQLIKKNWKKHREKNIYQDNGDFLIQIQREGALCW